MKRIAAIHSNGSQRFIEPPVPNVPYGVRGVAEMPIVPVAACVGNAIRRAVGVRMAQMPMTPERIVKMLKRRPD